MKKSLLTWPLFMLTAATALAQETGPYVREGATVQLGEHTYAIPDANAPAVPNVGIVVGERATLVIDPGMGRRNGEAVLREARKVSNTDALYIATTHFHPEHTTGNLAFPESATYINSSVQEQEFADRGRAIIRYFERRSPQMAELLEGVEQRPADIIFDRRYALDLGGVTVHMQVVGPTHTQGDTVFFVEEDQVLFAGDVLMKESFLAANRGSSVKAWLDAFEVLEAMEPANIVPAHGAFGTASLIPANRRLVEAIRDRALALKGEGKSAEEAAAVVDSELRAQHPEWPRAQGIAPLAAAAWNEASQ
ncbi:MBL fold metallo-hydrolase [Gilvimarinus sp. F26214L]|uniref:MBL fold metallo-hydrolase n=1 Tax=Gilvimarinus sp. DZF01 TaxID=3461371 RepID=UPI004046811F